MHLVIVTGSSAMLAGCLVSQVKFHTILLLQSLHQHTLHAQARSAGTGFLLYVETIRHLC